MEKDLSTCCQRHNLLETALCYSLDIVVRIRFLPGEALSAATKHIIENELDLGKWAGKQGANRRNDIRPLRSLAAVPILSYWERCSSLLALAILLRNVSEHHAIYVVSRQNETLAVDSQCNLQRFIPLLWFSKHSVTGGSAQVMLKLQMSLRELTRHITVPVFPITVKDDNQSGLYCQCLRHHC